MISFAAQWLAYTHPCRRFAPGLAADDARLGADVVRYSFIVVDLHHLLLVGLPAHCHRNSPVLPRAPLHVFAPRLIQIFKQRRSRIVELVQLAGHDRPQYLWIDVAIFVPQQVAEPVDF